MMKLNTMEQIRFYFSLDAEWFILSKVNKIWSKSELNTRVLDNSQYCMKTGLAALVVTHSSKLMGNPYYYSFYV
jgi:hypothetical protein